MLGGWEAGMLGSQVKHPDVRYPVFAFGFAAASRCPMSALPLALRSKLKFQG
jgi:hypothetical protein